MVKLEKAIEDHMDEFIQSGLFMAIEKLRQVTLKNFVQKVATVIAKEPVFPGKPHRIPLQVLFNKLIEWDSDLDLDELECLLANLIGNNLIKGYLSHESRILVLAPKDAFN
mmetsp:Transcript_29937/g.21693  ORF Transcript_29937/g.21693 Transcript_29937/m.21693 type:complete len:111 (-) Transcript_29937:43-375(-)